MCAPAYSNAYLRTVCIHECMCVLAVGRTPRKMIILSSMILHCDTTDEASKSL